MEARGQRTTTWRRMRMRRRRWCVHAALGVNSAVPAVRPYTVRKGDTVETIVKKRGIALDEVAKLNTKLDLSTLSAGQTLLLPSGRFSARDMQMLQGLEAGTSQRRYTVRDGEKIEEIAGKRGIDEAEIRALNPRMNLRRLRGGDILVLPERFSPREREVFAGYVPLEFLQDKPPFWVRIERALRQSHTAPMRPYTVRKGDTLVSICSKRGLSETDMRALNKHVADLDALEPGRTILIPGGTLSKRDKLILAGIETGGVRHYPVREGETLEDIIAKRNISRDEIASLNPKLNLRKRLSPGTELLLPVDRFTIREMEALQGSGTVPSEYFAPTSVVKADFIIGLSVFAALGLGGVWALVKERERKSIRDRLDKFTKKRK